MKLYRISSLFLLFFFGLLIKPVFADNQNIFGLHLSQTSDLEKAAPIINSSQGDWGYATIVIRTDLLNQSMWQDFFDKCRKYHIIPIIRLGTMMENGNWKKPEYQDIDNLATFLNQLNWPTKQQIIIPFNEINHGTEWGGEVDIKNFADISIYTYQQFKNLNTNFYILATPLDYASPEKPPQFKKVDRVYQEIYLYNPKYFDSFDAIASHSYPNHGYIGLPTDKSIHSIIGYQYQLDIFKKLGVKNNYDVYLTETGWPHREGEQPQNNLYTTNTTAKFFNEALAIWQKDPKVKAVTPFTFNYPYQPFDHFSWVDKSETLYPAYQAVVDYPKTANHPEQITDYQLVKSSIPLFLIAGSEYGGQITLKNTGQSVWGETNFCLNPISSDNIITDAICTPKDFVYPGQTWTFEFKFKVNKPQNYTTKSFLQWDNLPAVEIIPFTKTGSIYSPKNTINEQLRRFLSRFFL